MLGEVLTAIVTPFRADGTVDLGCFRALCRHLVENGSDGVVVTGTTGEAPTLSDDDRFALCEVAVDELGGDHGYRRFRLVVDRPFGAPHRARA
jgi:4-hydroxy-tetrahydrodipicolinate synthase